MHHAPRPMLFPYTTLFRSLVTGLYSAVQRKLSPANSDSPIRRRRTSLGILSNALAVNAVPAVRNSPMPDRRRAVLELASIRDRKSTRLNSSHLGISYAVFC